jgi:hypothetical protein
MAHFYEWFRHAEYKDKVPADPHTLTDEERELRKQFDLTLNQVTWRRKKIIALRQEFPEKYPENDLNCFLLQGQAFFDQDKLLKRQLQLANFKPFMVSDDKTMVFFHKRIKGRRYVVGADPASGKMVTNQDTDRSAAVVLDEETGMEVAAFCDRLPPEEFALALIELART